MWSIWEGHGETCHISPAKASARDSSYFLSRAPHIVTAGLRLCVGKIGVSRASYPGLSTEGTDVRPGQTLVDDIAARLLQRGCAQARPWHVSTGVVCQCWEGFPEKEKGHGKSGQAAKSPWLASGHSLCAEHPSFKVPAAGSMEEPCVGIRLPRGFARGRGNLTRCCLVNTKQLGLGHGAGTWFKSGSFCE